MSEKSLYEQLEELISSPELVSSDIGDSDIVFCAADSDVEQFIEVFSRRFRKLDGEAPALSPGLFLSSMDMLHNVDAGTFTWNVKFLYKPAPVQVSASSNELIQRAAIGLTYGYHSSGCNSLMRCSFFQDGSSIDIRPFPEKPTSFQFDFPSSRDRSSVALRAGVIPMAEGYIEPSNDRFDIAVVLGNRDRRDIWRAKENIPVHMRGPFHIDEKPHLDLQGVIRNAIHQLRSQNSIATAPRQSAK